MRQELVRLDLAVQTAEYFFHNAHPTYFLEDVRRRQQPSVTVQAVQKALLGCCIQLLLEVPQQAGHHALFNRLMNFQVASVLEPQRVA